MFAGCRMQQPKTRILRIGAPGNVRFHSNVPYLVIQRQPPDYRDAAVLALGSVENKRPSGHAEYLVLKVQISRAVETPQPNSSASFS